MDAPTQPPAPLHTNTVVCSPLSLPSHSLRRLLPQCVRRQDAPCQDGWTTRSRCHPQVRVQIRSTGKILLTVNPSPGGFFPRGGHVGALGPWGRGGTRSRCHPSRGADEIEARARRTSAPFAPARKCPRTHSPERPHSAAAASAAGAAPPLRRGAARRACARSTGVFPHPPPHTPVRLPIFLLSRPTPSLASGLFLELRCRFVFSVLSFAAAV